MNAISITEHRVIDGTKLFPGSTIGRKFLGCAVRSIMMLIVLVMPLRVDATSTKNVVADVLSVKITDSVTGFFFSVKIASPDRGCNQYANWWEVLDEQGKLLHRRVLVHSHVDEQPFERSGGPIVIKDTETVIVRAHMYPNGYGGITLKGSTRSGFTPVILPAGFGAQTATAAPEKTECAF